ncbi:MAG: flagellar basal body-associated FliL family protein [Candidatus Marinimicrobia bacterium]|nr:flagellar basal body-associated FliL family protein [Candidatus Neomarinimicrobiota bacterium]
MEAESVITDVLENGEETALDNLRKNPKKMAIIGVGVLLSLALNGLLAYYLTKSIVLPVFYGSSADSEASEEVIESPSGQKPEALPVQADGNSETGSDERFSIFKVEHIVINPYGTNGRRFLALNLSIEVTNGDVAKELKEKDAELRDKLNTLLSRNTVAELTNIISKRKIKMDIKRLLNKMIDKGEVREIYFTKYVLQ